MKNKIFIDGVIFQIQKGRPAGISRVWQSLITELSKSQLADKVTIIDRNNSFPDIKGFNVIAGNEYIQNTFESDSLYIQHLINQNGAGLFLSTYYTYPENSPCVITLYDMVPEAMSFDLNHPEWRAKQKAIEKSSAFFSISEATRKDFCYHYPQHSSKQIITIPLAISESFKIPQPWESELFKRTFSIKKPYFIFNGHRLGYKNAISFIKAFNLLPEKDRYEILFTGGAREMEKIFAELLGSTKYQIQFLNDKELSIAYSGAVALVYPSLYEGFGLPIIEAMKMGCPVIAGTNSSIPEVAGDGAILIDTKNISKLSAALARVREPEVRNELIKNGNENIKRFSWEKAGHIFVTTLGSLLTNFERLTINSSDPIDSWQRYLQTFYTKPDSKELLLAFSDSIKCFNAQGSSMDFSRLIETEKRIVKFMNSVELEQMNQACRISNNDVFLIYWSGIILESKGLNEEALVNYLRLSKTGLTNLRITLLAANLAYKMGKVLTAEKLYRIIVSINNKHIESINRLKEITSKILEIKEGMEINEIKMDSDHLTSTLSFKKQIDDTFISVIIPTKDRNEGLEEILDSLPQAMYKLQYETILYCSKKNIEELKPVIEKYNISKVYYDEDVFSLNEKFSWPKLMNHGFKNSKGNWIVYASDDIQFYPFAFWNALTSIKLSDDVGGITFLHKNTVETYSDVFDNYGYDQVGQFPYINFGLVNRKAFEKINAFDEKFKFYWADVDLCIRIWESGYKIEVSPLSLVDHNNITDRLKQENSGDRYFGDTSSFFNKWMKRTLLKKDQVLLKKRKYLADPDLLNVMKNIQQNISDYLHDISSLSENLILNKINHSIKLMEENKKPLNQNRIKVSAIVSTYNSEKFIRGCLDDLLNQTIYQKGELEIVVVNSGSTENEESIVKEYQSKFQNIKYLKTERETIYSAWNRAINLSSGKYIANANTDDRHRNDALELMATKLDQNEEAGLVYADQCITYHENQTYEKHVSAGYFEWPEFDRIQLIHCASCGPQPMWRKKLHDEFGYFDGNLVVAGDYEWWLRISEKVKFLHIPEKLGLYHLSDDSIEHRYNSEMTNETNKVRTQYAKAVKLKSLDYKKYKSTFIKFSEQPLLFSVIITTYNRPSQLKSAVESVLNQTITNLELIVVNDGGVGIEEHLSDFNDDRLKIINRLENGGPAAARNSGINIAKGMYISFLDDDDIYLNYHLETALKFLRKGNSVVYTDSYRYSFKKIGNDYKLIKKSIPYSIDYSKNKLLLGNISPVNCFVFEKSLLKDSGSFNEDFKVLEDWEFWLRLSTHSNFYHIKKPTVLVNWKDDGTTLTSSRQKEFRVFHERINKMYYSEIKNIKDPQEIISEFQTIWMNDMITKPVVSIIVPTFNQLNYSRECFESIFSYTKTPFELIVIINNKSDGTMEYLQQLSKVHNNIKIISNDENQGFPVSINQGINVSVSEFVLIINNDIVLTEGWIESLLDVANKNESVGIVGPISNEVSGLQKDSDAVYKTIDEMHQYAAAVKGKNKNEVLEFPRVAFLCTLIKKEVIDKIGGLDERFSPGNYEDDDFCLRAQLAGYKTVIAKDVFIHHYGSKSFKADGDEKYSSRLKTNEDIFIKKWGATPDEIWIHGKDFNHNRSTFFPVSTNIFKQYFDRAKLCITEKEFELALSNLDATITNYEQASGTPNEISLSELFNLAGNVSLIKNNLDSAKKYFEEELKLNPNSSSACFGLGEVFFVGEIYDGAKTMYEWALANDSTNSKAMLKLEEVNKQMGFHPAHNSLLIEMPE